MELNDIILDLMITDILDYKSLEDVKKYFDQIIYENVIILIVTFVFLFPILIYIITPQPILK